MGLDYYLICFVKLTMNNIHNERKKVLIILETPRNSLKYRTLMASFKSQV